MIGSPSHAFGMGQKHHHLLKISSDHHRILKERNLHISSDQSTGPEFQDTKSHVHSSLVP